MMCLVSMLGVALRSEWDETHLLALLHPSFDNLWCELITGLVHPLRPFRTATNDADVRTEQGILLLLVLGGGIVGANLRHVNDDGTVVRSVLGHGNSSSGGSGIDSGKVGRLANMPGSIGATICDELSCLKARYVYPVTRGCVTYTKQSLQTYVGGSRVKGVVMRRVHALILAKLTQPQRMLFPR